MAILSISVTLLVSIFIIATLNLTVTPIKPTTTFSLFIHMPTVCRHFTPTQSVCPLKVRPFGLASHLVISLGCSFMLTFLKVFLHYLNCVHIAVTDKVGWES